MKTMTLEYVHDLLASYGNAYMDAVHAIDAAIRERDELTAAVKLGKLCADVGAGYMQRARKAEAALAALRDAGHAKGVPSLLCGRTHEGRHYVLTGDKESVSIVSDLIAAREAKGERDELSAAAKNAEWSAEQQRARAEKAEAELAALKARIAKAPTAQLIDQGRVAQQWYVRATDGSLLALPPALSGKRVRLVVED